MKTLQIVIILIFIIPFSLLGQIKIKTSGQVEINGQTGSYYVDAARVILNSSGTLLTSANSGLSIVNTNTTLNNWTRLNFSTLKSDNAEEDFMALAIQYRNRTVGSISADFHIATSNYGYYAPRFSIYSNASNANDVFFFFNTGYTGGSGTGRGIWIDNSGNGEPTLRPNNSNYGYLGTSNCYWYRLYVNQAYYNSHDVITSDARSKENIKDIDKATINRLIKIRGVKYRLKNENTDNQKATNIVANAKQNNERPAYAPEQDANTLKNKETQIANQKEQYGLIAQEIKEIYPEVVEYDSNTDQYGIRYTELIPIMIEGMKEQQAIIEQQNNKIKALENKIAQISTKSGTIADLPAFSAVASLDQNAPNPFDQSTLIGFYLPDDVQKAVIYIYNMNGNQIKTIPINQHGNGSITINGSELQPGMYLYTLIADGNEIDTKRMILTE